MQNHSQNPLYDSFVLRLMSIEAKFIKSNELTSQADVMRQDALRDNFLLNEEALMNGVELKPSRIIPNIYGTSTVKQKIHFALAGQEPMFPAELIKRMQAMSAVKKQSVYVNLTRLVEEGFLLRTLDGRYSLKEDNTAGSGGAFI